MLRERFAGSRHLRLHVDENAAELVVMYPHMKANLLESARDFSGGAHVNAREPVVWGAGKGLEELHAAKFAMWGEFLALFFSSSSCLERGGARFVEETDPFCRCSWLTGGSCADVKPDNMLCNYEVDDRGSRKPV